MARVITSLKALIQAVTGDYEPAKHYMRGPGPKWHAKYGSLKQTQDGGSFPRIVDRNGTAKVAPDPQLS